MPPLPSCRHSLIIEGTVGKHRHAFHAEFLNASAFIRADIEWIHPVVPELQFHWRITRKEYQTVDSDEPIRMVWICKSKYIARFYGDIALFIRLTSDLVSLTVHTHGVKGIH